MTQKISLGYEIANDSSAKDLVYVLVIEDLPYIISSSVVFKKLRYGDPGVEYGGTYNGNPLVYGGLIPYGGLLNGGVDDSKQKSLLNMEKGGLSVSQKVEPWEGKASVSTLNFVLTDIKGEALKIISPGVLLDEIMLKRIDFYVGFKNVSFPEDFVKLYRGYVSGTQHEPGIVRLLTSDANIKRRQNLFEKSQTTLSSSISSGVTTIPVIATDGFYNYINAPGSVSPETGHTLGFKIDDEIITYTTNPGPTSFTGVTRGAFGTVAAAHSNGSIVTPIFHFTGNPLRVACKIMLSGWEGTPSVDNINITSIGYTGDSFNPLVDNSITFDGVDLKSTYGLVEGDFITISGATEAGNNQVELPIIEFFAVNDIENAGIVVDFTLIPELTSPAVAAFRSQFDVYPKECGLKMLMDDVDTARHIDTANQFLVDEVADFEFVITDQEDSGKTFIEKQLYMPAGGFSLTRSGRMSVVITAPPLPTIDIPVFSADDLIDADKFNMNRAVNDRKFYNRIDFSYDQRASDGDFDKFEKFINSDSRNRIQITELMNIEAKGLKSSRNAAALVDRMTRRTFERYKYCAQTIKTKVNYKLGTLVEAGDVVLIKDESRLKMPNLDNAERNLGNQLWEVLEKSQDLKTGVSDITIINGTGVDLNDRFGTISPSSEIESGISTTQFRITEDSFGAIFPLRDYKKWENYIGLNVMVHSDDFSQEANTVLIDIDQTDPQLFTVSPALPWVPGAGYVLDLANYSTSSDKADQEIAKRLHAFLSPGVIVVSGISNTQFTVGAGDVGKFWVGGIIVVHTDDDLTRSEEVEVTNISGVTITCEDLGFTPSASMVVTFIGFSYDQTQTYRFYG